MKNIVKNIAAGLLATALFTAPVLGQHGGDNSSQGDGMHGHGGHHKFKGRHKNHHGNDGYGKGHFGHHGMGGGKGLQAINSYSGKLVAYIANNDKIYYAFSLDMGGTTFQVKFPIHVGKQLMAAAKPGAVVTVGGFMDKGPLGTDQIWAMNVNAGGKIIEHKAKQRRLKDSQDQVTVEGTVAAFMKSDDGNVNGLQMNDKTIVHFPPSSGDELAGLVKPGDKIKLTGYELKEEDGVAYAEKVKIVRAVTVAFNGSTYMLR